MFLNEVMYLSQNAASPIFFVDCFPIRRNVVFVYLLFASHHKHCFQIHYAAPKATMKNIFVFRMPTTTCVLQIITLF